MNRWEKELVSDCVNDLITHGMTVKLIAKDGLTHAGGDCSGWFDDKTREIAIACKREDWIAVFAHEYCHFTQFKDGMFDGYDDDTLWDWLEGKDFPKEVLDHVVQEAKDLEADNERRTVALLEKYAIPIDLSDYAKKVNAYLLFYNTVRRYRKWSSVGYPRPYDVPEILARMEGEILEDFSDGPQWNWFHDLVREHCYDGNVTTERILRADENRLVGKSYLHVVGRQGRNLVHLLRASLRRFEGLVRKHACCGASTEVRKD